jgi:methanogenic corrinoid protein MtbC1
MSQNNIIPSKLPNVEKLINKLAVAERNNAREVRLTIQETRDIVSELTVLTTKMAGIIIEINQQLQALGKKADVITIDTDGGGFS